MSNPKTSNVKNYSDTYLFSKLGNGKYEKVTFEYLMSSKEIDKNDKSFQDVVYDVKRRQVTSNLLTVLNSKNTVLMVNETPLSRAWKIFYCNDVRTGDKKSKIFIDVSEIFKESNEGTMICTDVDKLIAYLVTAMNTMIYYQSFNSYGNNTKLIESSTSCFTDLFSYVLDYLRISGYSAKRSGCAYFSALYFQYNMLNKDIRTDSAKRIAQSVSNINNRDGDILNSIIDEKDLEDIDTFVSFLSSYLKEEKLKTNVIVDKWTYLIGVGTYFGLEMFPAFCSIITNAYCGVYLNNQKNIEKNAKDMIAFTRCLFKIGSDLI